jgi:hypothetical protein
MFEFKLWIGLPLLATVVAVPGLTINERFAAGCAIVGLMGGFGYQLVTNDSRKPPLKVVFGDLIFSSAFGYGAYAITGRVEPYTIFAAFCSGAVSSVTWWKIASHFGVGAGKDKEP